MNEYQHRAADLQKGYEELRRTSQHTKLYVDACRDIGRCLGIPVVDIWSAFLKKAGWTKEEALIGSLQEPRSEIFDNLFSDGILTLVFRTYSKADSLKVFICSQVGKE